MQGAWLALVALLWLDPALAAGRTDPDWPCVQRKVPEVSAGTMWSGPQVAEGDRAWERSKPIAALVTAAASRRTSLDDAKAAIDAFAATLGADRNRRLTLLFTGLLQTVNAERRSIMSGIERYARRQAALAEKIKAEARKLNGLRKASRDAEDRGKRIDALEKQLQWDTRIFDEREQSLRYVCEAPVLLEQRLFALARTIMAHLE